jgi:hypothetical protein
MKYAPLIIAFLIGVMAANRVGFLKALAGSS